MKRLIPFFVFLLTACTMSAQSIYDVSIESLEGQEMDLAQYQGKVLLIVNVASACGYTPQYRGLQALYDQYGEDGLVVIGVPCNQFGKQESGSNEEIAEFCSSEFGVTFPMTSKVKVNGPERHALYDILAGDDAAFPGDIRWNFTKFLVGRDGTVLKRFDSAVRPKSDTLVEPLKAALLVK